MAELIAIGTTEASSADFTTNVTSLKFISDTASSLAVGSVVKVYRLS